MTQNAVYKSHHQRCVPQNKQQNYAKLPSTQDNIYNTGKLYDVP